MKNGIVIADSGPIFSLALIDKLDILNEFFKEIYIPNAVWEEITNDKTTPEYSKISQFFQSKVRSIKELNQLTFVLDYGESEAVILYQDLEANFLLIDDKKARGYAENLDIRCIGTIGILTKAKSENLLNDLRPIFLELINNNRYYSPNLLNILLAEFNEDPI